MEGGQTTGSKIRFVRCPRCRETLPESPDYPLYRCGRCDTIIQAKSRRTRCVDVEPDLVNTSVQASVLEVKEARSSLDKDQLGNSEETSMSEEMLTSPDIACSKKQHTFALDVDASKRKGKNKLIEDNVEDQEKGDGHFQGVCQVKNLVGTEKQESSLILYGNRETNQSQSKDLITAPIMDCASTSDPLVPSDSPLSDSHVSLYLTSPDQEYPDFEAPSLRRNGLLETCASSPVTDFSSEIDMKSKPLSTYPASSSYYAYDGSESSFDGIDDRQVNKFSRPSRKAKHLDHMSSGEGLSEAGFKVKGYVSGRVPPGDDPMKSWIPERYSDMKRCTVEPEKLRNITVSQFASGDALSTNSNLHVFNSSEKQKGLKSDKLDLLRTVWELTDHLDKMRFSKPQLNAGFAVQDANFSDYPERHRLSMDAFPKGNARYGNQGCSCSHCCPRNFNSSAQLPLHHKNSHHFEHKCCDIYSSASQQHRTRKNISEWKHEENPAIEMKLKNMRKHILPAAGGAPFIACHYCWKLLEIPSELFISRKRCLKLMCGVCKKIMRLSLHKGVHLGPHFPEPAASPCESDGAGSHKSLCLSSCHNVQLQSSGKTGELSPPRRCSRGRKNSHIKEIASGVSSEGTDDGEKKRLRNKPRNKKDSVTEQPNMVCSCSYEKVTRTKKTTESKEAATSSNSPLHHLMGYSSVSQVFKS